MWTLVLATLLTLTCSSGTRSVQPPDGPVESDRPGSIGRVGTADDVTSIRNVPLIFLGGGSTDQDDGMRRFVSAAGGGNLTVIRASGSTGYNDYLFGLSDAASVETFLLDRRELAEHPQTNALIGQSEALFVAGGDQWSYTRFWNGTHLSATLDTLIHRRRIPFGGTSAGAMIWGGRYFDASAGSVVSAEALANPFHPLVTLRPALFRTPAILEDRIIDTHFSERGRQGRLMVFLARSLRDGGMFRGIAIDERTALVIDAAGIGTVYGAGFVWMYLPFGDAGGITPESMVADTPFTWYRNGRAVLVWKLGNGDRFDLHRNRPLDRPSSYFATVRQGVFAIEAIDPASLD